MSLSARQPSFLSSCRQSISHAVDLIRTHKKAFIILQCSHHGLLLGAMVLPYFYPILQNGAGDSARRQLDNPVGRYILSVYAKGTGSVVQASLITFVVNLSIGAFSSITLTSMMFPFLGLVVQGWRAVQWGFLFSPAQSCGIPHYITLIMEGQAYVITSLGSWILGSGVLSKWLGYRKQAIALPVEQEQEQEQDKMEKYWPGYWQGLRDNWSLYSLIVPILAVSAVWEAYEVIHLL